MSSGAQAGQASPSSSDSRLAPVARALWAQARSREAMGLLEGSGIRCLVLKGPELQSRLYGTPAAYTSSDADILVPRPRGRSARQALQREGWTFEPDNSVLWFLSEAATYAKEGFRLDLHWGLHAAHLPGVALRTLEARLWKRASRGPHSFLEPDPESLLVFLAVHVVGHSFERSQWLDNVHSCEELVRDWDEVWRIARASHVEGAVQAALKGNVTGTRIPILDGMRGRVVSGLSWTVRGHFLSQEVRAHIREAVGLAREGFGPFSGAGQRCRFGPIELFVPKGVFTPKAVSERLIDLAEKHLSPISRPVVVEVGTGCGAIALALGTRSPSARILAIDLSQRAVRAARKNQARLGVKNVKFVQGDLIDRLPSSLNGRVDVVIANLPYVDPVTTSRNTWDAPLSAIQGPDSDGLGLLRKLALDIRPLLVPSGGLFTFQLADYQWDSFSEYLRGVGYSPESDVARRPNAAVVASATWGRPS